MIFENMEHNCSSLISYMEASGYSKRYIEDINMEIRWIIKQARNQHWKDYNEVLMFSRATQERTKFSNLNTIMQFYLNGKYPDGRKSILLHKEKISELKPEFKMLIEHFRAEEQKRGLKHSSVSTELSKVVPFLTFLQNNGIDQLEKIKEETVMSFFLSPDLKPLKSVSYRSCVAAFIKACTPINPDACRRVLSFIPKSRQKRKNIQYLNEQEAQAYLDTMDDKSNALTLRDRAIGKLSYYTGLRGSDISALQLSSIDWDCDQINVIQEKTENPLELPLTAVVGNAIYDYLVEERPQINSPYLFLTQELPYRKMDRLWHVTDRIMRAAGIRQQKGERKGLHLFRHHLVTTLMRNDIPHAVISDTIGHISPSSLDPYLYADIEHLRECALSLDRFPITLGVFAIE